MRKEDDEGDLDDNGGVSLDEEDLLEEPKKDLFGRRGSKEDGDFEFDLSDDRELELGLGDSEDRLADPIQNSVQYGNLQDSFEMDRWDVGTGERISIEETEEGGHVMSLKDAVGSVKDLMKVDPERVLGKIKELGRKVMGSNEGEFGREQIDENSLQSSKEDNLLGKNKSRNSINPDFVNLDQIVANGFRNDILPSMDPKQARQLGETYCLQLNRALGSEFESLIAEHLSEVVGLLGSDHFEIQPRMETGDISNNGAQQFIIPDMILYNNGEVTNILEMKVGVGGLKLKDVEYAIEHFPEASIKYIFLKSSEDKAEEMDAIEDLVDEYLDRNGVTGDNELSEVKEGILSRVEIWNMDDVEKLLPENAHDDFWGKVGKVKTESVLQSEDYIQAFNSFNRLNELTEELKEFTRGGVNEDQLELVDRSIEQAENGENAYQTYINMAILQKVVAEGTVSPGDLQKYLGMAENTTLSYTNPMIDSGIIKHTEIYPGTAFLYFSEDKRPTYYSTLRPDTKAGFELMQQEAILPKGEITHSDAVDVLGDRPQRKATVFNLFNMKKVIGEADIANVVNVSHLESASRADRRMKWMYNNGMINRDQLPWDSGHYYYWLKSQKDPEFCEIRKFMGGNMKKSIEFIENTANFQFSNFDDFRKFLAPSNSNSSLEKSWRKAVKVLPAIEELTARGLSGISVEDIKDLSKKGSKITNKTLEVRLKILTDANIISENSGIFNLNKKLTGDEITSKIQGFEKLKTLTYSKTNFNLDTDLKIAKEYALKTLGDMGIARGQIIELKGSGQKIHYLLNRGEINIFHSGSLKELLPEYKDRTLTDGLRKLAKMGILEKFTIPNNLKGTGNLVSYYRARGVSESSLSDLKELLDIDIKSLFSDIENLAQLNIWKKTPGDLRNTLTDHWLQDLQVLRVAYDVINAKTGRVNFQQLVTDAEKLNIFRSDIKKRVSGSLKRISRSDLNVIKMTKISAQKYEYHIE